ncbi:uncharacterized protein LOC117109790 isoform X2 [Anneissia japonica]|nr:uncharacterized protein LOC117109790 isoform X2 [Anneissia japonica]
MHVSLLKSRPGLLSRMVPVRAIDILFVVILFNPRVQSFASNYWEGGCANDCDKSIARFCQEETRVCMECKEFCDLYPDRCSSVCQAYLTIPEVHSQWEGCAELCQYDINYFCELSTETCMRCDGLCGISTRRDQCYENCAGYMKMVLTTPTTHFSPKSTYRTPSLVLPGTTPTSLPPSQITDSPQFILPDDASVMSLPIIVTVAICVGLVVIVVGAVNVHRRRSDRNGGQQQNHEQRELVVVIPINGGGGQDDANETLRYPVEEEDEESKELQEVGGPIRSNFPLMRDG